MDDLAPAAHVPALAQPAAPEIDRLDKELAGFVFAVAAGPDVAVAVLEHEREPLVGLHRDLADNPAVLHVQRSSRRKGERDAVRPEEKAVVSCVRLVGAAGVVEAGVDLDPEDELAADAQHRPHDPIAPTGPRRHHGHAVDYLGHALVGREARDEYVRVGEVELARLPGPARGLNPEMAALLAVDQRRKDAGGVEAAGAVPVDRAVGADEGDAAQVSDDAVLFDRQVAGGGGRRGALGEGSQDLSHAALVLVAARALQRRESARRRAPPAERRSGGGTPSAPSGSARP